jgi:ATP-dependent helicase/nuclease subunit A
MADQNTIVRDNAGRELILTALKTNLLVEAAAGTGKTTSMVGRMVELVAGGICEPDRIAAVTFTRKAAGELRTRFREELEHRLDEGSESGERASRLARALEQQGLGFIGTIHAFCARLLRERPVEAGIDPDFSEMEMDQDGQWRMDVWQEYLANLIAEGDSVLEKLELMGIEPNDLESAYSKFCNYPDVDLWALPENIEPLTATGVNMLLAPRIEKIRRRLRDFADDHDLGGDMLLPLYRQLSRMYAQADKGSIAELAAILETCKHKKVVQKVWGDTSERKKLARDERDEWKDFCEQRVEPLLVRWRSCRYALCLDVLERAAQHYRDVRLQAGRLNFTDLLIAARDLLKNSAQARAYFAERFTHLLVDEFQDTDPVQAEIMMLLTADNADCDQWTRCRPRAGSLFVVGDPKQSIYRFRRADIITYENVRQLIENSGGEVVRLWSNFRTRPEVVEWINGRFESMFGGDSYSPQYVALEAARAGEGGSVERLWLDKAGSVNNSAVFGSEPRMIAAAVRELLENSPAGQDPDVLVLSWKRKNLGHYSAALDSLGIPNQVTGSKSLGNLPQIRLLYLAARAAANPEDQVATVALLRSEAFGLSDPQLYEFVRRGGEFNYRRSLPDGLESGTSELYRDVFSRMRRHASWLGKLGAVPALERIATEMGLFAQAAASRGGNQCAGGLARALELVRTRSEARHCLPDALEVLRRLAEGELEADSMEARPGIAPPVRVMNVHKAKGLEAGVVFLADPTGAVGSRSAEVHVDRAQGRSTGYLAIERPGRFGKGSMLACHPNWSTLEQEEGKFLEAERVRLLYVAATRARDRLVVSSRESHKSKNPWSDFDSALEDAPALDHGALERPWEVEPTAEVTDSVQPPDLVSVWQEVSEEKYFVRQAKEVALDGQLAVPGATGEHGMEWGSAVHSLLEAGARNPGSDLMLLAGRVLDPEQCKPFGVPAVVDTVASVLASKIWARASRARKMLAEAPFEFVREVEGREVLLRGSVDLAFDEGDGWVLVDYKTDSTEDGRLQGLVDHYAPQLKLYAEAWQQASGEKVKEIGLNFTGSGLYTIVD